MTIQMPMKFNVYDNQEYQMLPNHPKTYKIGLI